MEAGVGAGGGICAACTESLQMYCFTKRYGSGSQNTQAGCCGSCFKKSFDEDEFEQRRDGPPVSTQPTAQKPMDDKAATNPGPVTT